LSSDKRTLFTELIDEVRRSQLATQRFDQAVADALGLNRTDMRCLDVIERAGRLPAGRIAEETGLTSGAVTTVLDRLEQAGYARRVPDPGDRRRVLVELTDAAKEFGTRFYAAHMAASEQLYKRHTADELALMLEFVRASRRLNEEQAARLEAETRAGATRGPARGRRR
jgi:DNA-binding MarR family transcriptional regulator